MTHPVRESAFPAPACPQPFLPSPTQYLPPLSGLVRHDFGGANAGVSGESRHRQMDHASAYPTGCLLSETQTETANLLFPPRGGEDVGDLETKAV